VSQGLRIVSETWSDSRDTLTLQAEGFAGRTYALSVWGAEQIKSIDGAHLMPGGSIEVSFLPANRGTEPQSQTITIHFAEAKKIAQQANTRN